MTAVADFLIERMANAGLKHVFGVPGDYVLSFYKKLAESSMDLVGNSDEAHAGFAANSYARVAGVGGLCVTYNVGALKVANAVACAYAERAPVVVICGSPGMKERDGLPLHHMVRNYECQKNIFEQITCASTVLDNPNRAGFEIDRVFAAMLHQKRPVYIELPRDMVDKPLVYDVYKQGTPQAPKSDDETLEEGLMEVVELLEKAKNPVIVAGVQISRFGMGNSLLKFAEKFNIPVVTTLLGKSVISEKHPLFAGVYFTRKDVRDFVDSSDCLIAFGEVFTDISLNCTPNKIKQPVVSCSLEGLKVKNHLYPEVYFQDFCKALFRAELMPKKFPKFGYEAVEEQTFVAEKGRIKTARFFSKINSILTEDNIVLADVGDSMFGASDLVCHHKDTFLGSAFYTSMGTAIPGALGVQLAKPHLRPIVLVGDGAFQMSVSELSTIVTRGLNPVVFVLNNHGYSTERCLADGAFNDIRNWNYHKSVEMIGGGIGFHVTTEEELEVAVKHALGTRELSIINVDVDEGDISASLKRMAATHAKRI